MILNLNAVTVAAALGGVSSLISFSASALEDPSDTPKLDELKAKYDLENPTRNHQTDTFDPKLEAYFTQPIRDMSGKIGTVLSTPVPTRTIDLSGYNLSRTMEEQLDMAKSLSSTHGTPKQDGAGYKAEYSKSATRQFTRDGNGNLQIKAVEGVDRVVGLNDNDMLGAELNNPNYASEANKQDLYGDNNAIYTEGKNTHLTFNDADGGKSASARGYRAITRSSQRGIDTNIQETDPFLQPSFAAVGAAQDPNLMFSSCTEETVPVTNEFFVSEKKEFKCQDLYQVNNDFCEVERDIKPLVVLSEVQGITVEECGDGCIDIYMGNKNDNAYSGNCVTVSKTAKFKLSQEYPISSVTLSEAYVDDHAVVKVNGSTAWSFVNGVAGSTGSLSSVTKCDLRKSWRPKHNGAMQSALQNAQASGDGEVIIQFDTLVGGGGEGFLKFRVRFTDPTGNHFKGDYTQYPEGCYDALTLADKTTKPLAGIYDSQLFTDEYDIYQCTSPSVTPICKEGDFIIGGGSSQTCHTPADESRYCDIGTYNPVGETCEVEPSYYCPPRSGTPCGGGLVSIGEEADLNGSSCTYHDYEHCGSWEDTVPASIQCTEDYELIGGKCVQSALTTFICPDGQEPEISIQDGVEVYGCESEAISYTPRVWSCSGAFTYHDAYCDIQLGSEIDTAYCAKPKPNTEFLLPKGFCSFEEYQSIDVSTRNYPTEFLDKVVPFYDGDQGYRTWKVNLFGYECDPTQGQLMCVIDPDTGEESCFSWDELKAMPDQCAEYKANPSCAEIRRVCSEGWYEEHTGRCISDSVVYECTSSSTIEIDTEVTRNSCAGMLPCIGGDCEFTDPETNPNFVKAMVAGSILDEAQDDTSCTDPTDETTCSIFNGDFKYCSWETSGLGMDCCEEAKGVDILAYVTFTRQMLKVGQMAGSGAFGTGAQGMYQTLSTPITSAADALAGWANTAATEIGTFVQGAYSSTVNSLMGSSEVVTATGEAAASLSSAAAGETLTATMEAALAALQQEVYSFVYNMLPDTLANLIFTETANVALGETSKLVMNETLTNFMSNVMAVYAAYQMIKLALTLLTACDELEMDMGVKLAQRTCFAVGDSYCAIKYPLGACMQNRQNYCCYSSILSRIIMKESYSQLNINPLPFGNEPVGEQREASCPGLTFEQLGQVNFDAPSMQTALQEWIKLLIDSEAIPTTTSEQSLTGGAEVVEDSCQTYQQPVVNCVIDAITLEEVCTQVKDASGNLVYQEAETECTYKATNGQIWNAYGRKTTSERTQENVGNAQDRVQESKNFIREAANSLDCSVYPRPPSCDFGFDPREGGP